MISEGLFNLSFLSEGRGMGRRIAAFNWNDTSLGPLETWPLPLLSAMKVMLLTDLPMYIAWGEELTLIYNDAYGAAFLEKHPAALGRPLREVWDAMAWTTIAPEIEQALAGRPYVAKHRPHPLGRTSDAATAYFTFCTVPLSDETGRVRGIFCSGYDTTAEMRERNAYKAESERLRDLFDQAPGFMAVLRGADHVFEIANDAFLELVGRRPIIGKSVREALPEVLGQGYLELLDQVYETKKPHVAIEAPVMLRRAPTGVAEERLVTFIYQPIRDAIGDISGIFVEGSDVTDAVQARARQKEVERLARATMDSLGEHIAVIDEAGTIIVVNDAWRKFAEGNGVAASAVSEGRNYFVACDKAAAAGDTLAGEVAALIREVAAGSRSTAEIEYPCHSPVEERWFHLKIARFKDDGPVRVVVAHEDITARHKSDQRIEYLATHDALTGLPNRRLFQDRAAQAFEHSKRAGLGTAILFLDLDNFKLVNDAYGHAIGDEVLVSIAQLLASMIRSGDTIARFGGDELAILLTDLRNPAINADKIVRGIIERLGSSLSLGGREITVTASIGISIFPDDGQTLEELVKNADAAMYRAKAVGRSGYQFYSPEMSARANERVLLEKELRRAIRRNELTVAYQPQVSLSTGSTIGVEALLRWTHPELGSISPSRFIPIAEETGLIGDLGRFVLFTACGDGASWARAGVPRVPVAVNVSAAQLWQADFVDSVASAIAVGGLDPSMLELEITEGIMMDRGEGVVARIGELRRLGVSLAIDDFGTGYSNLRYLKAFSPTRLKIDRWFVEGLSNDPNALSIARAIVALGNGLGLKVLAEGVETVEQARLLREMGCEEAQGFLYSGALSADDVEVWLKGEREPRATGARH